MSLSFVEIADHPSGASVSSLTVNLATVSVDDLMVLAFGFEGVGAGSAPWIVPNTNPSNTDGLGPAKGWKQIAQQAPGATGCGLEVWAAILGSGDHIIAQFNASYAVQCVAAIYSGEYLGSSPSILNGAIRGSTSQPVSGNNPAAPSVYSYVDELVIAIAADTVGSGFTAPAGFSGRGDYSRAGAGTVEVTVADKPTTVEGDTGSIPFTAAASPAGAAGATATLAVRPAPPAATSPLIAIEFAVAT